MVKTMVSGNDHLNAIAAYGTPLSTILTGADRHDATRLLALVEAVPPVHRQRG